MTRVRVVHCNGEQEETRIAEGYGRDVIVVRDVVESLDREMVVKAGC